jgi:hypothetical protein
MGILKTIGDFIFGKDPQIFDERGRVRHQFPEEKWTKWNDRYKAPSFDWRQHSAKQAAEKPQKKN